MAFLLLFSFALHATNPNHIHPYDNHEHATENTEHTQVEFHVASLIHAEDKKWWVQWLFIQQSFALPGDTDLGLTNNWQQPILLPINFKIQQSGSYISNPITLYMRTGILEYRDYA